MLIFGKSVSDWQEKARYAEDKADNEFAKLWEVRCEGIEDVQTGFALMATLAAATNCKQFLYHATINLNPGERLTRAQWQKAVDTLEANLKLTGHHRVVFEHIKKDRQHYHIVWSRIPPTGDGPAVNMGNNYAVNTKTAIALEKEFGLKPAPRRDKTKPSHMKQEINDRNGRVRVKPEIVTEDVTKIFFGSKTAKDFINNLAKAGYTLTKGKNGSYVVVDKQGGYHGLMRRINGVKLAEFNRKFPGFDKLPLPSLNTVLQNRRPVSKRQFKQAARNFGKPARLPAPSRRQPSITYRPRQGVFTGLIASANSRKAPSERKYYPLPIMKRRKRKKYENEPVKLNPNRAKIEQAELLQWAWENKRYDVLAGMGIHLVPEDATQLELIQLGIIPPPEP